MKIFPIYRYAWVVALAMALMGCVAGEDIDSPDNMKIRLWAGIDNASANKLSTRGDANSTSGILTPTTNEKLTIGMVRIDELYSDDYPAFVNCGNDGKPNPIKAELDLPDPNNSYYRDINFLSSSQFFYTANDIVKFAAWYPYDETCVYESTAEKTTVKFPIPGDVDVMYGNVSTGSQTNGFDIMTFDHALCVYRIYIYCMHGGDEGSNWGQLQTMTMEDLPASCTITLPNQKDGDAAKVFTIEYDGEQDIELDDPSNNIYFNPGNDIPVGLANRHLAAKCISAPPADGLLHISLTTSNAVARQRVSIARNFQAGHAYDIVLRFSDHGLINADVSVADWTKHDHDVNQDVTVDMFYDLSRYGTANCYLINSANYGYSFDATVKGNGDSSLVGNVDTTLEPGYIDILWDDMPKVNGEPTVQLASNYLSNHRVLFKVLGNPNNIDDKALQAEGSVIIAAYKDSSKSEILWTWHLWLTDRVNNHGNPNGYIVQDRNLGAVAPAPDGNGGENMYGLYYQWGRPTPFRANVAKTATTKQAATADEAVQHPTMLYGSGASNGDWLATTNNQLWGYQNDFTKIQKTIYDPCPQGYMVADKRVWESVATYQTTDGWQEGGLGAKIEVSGNTIWYPIQGYIDANGSANTAVSQVRLWSSVVDINNTQYPYELRYNRSSDATVTPSQYRNVALPVRCVSGFSTENITNLSAAQTANCYMVHRPGYYKFKATVRGNGVTQLLATSNNTTIVKDIADGMSGDITPAKVDFLWYQGDFNDGWTNDKRTPDQNEIPMILMNNGKPDESGYVTFYVGEFHKGNVGLAAYDNTGNILWSWHLWFTDTPEDIATGNYALMDRFLGATYAPTISGNSITFANNNQQLATYGFYYQWGRKDPFYGPRTVNATDNTNNDTPQCSTYWTKAYNGEWSARDTFDTAGQVRVSEAPATPRIFRKRSGTSDGGDNSFWYTSDIVTSKTSQHLWGYGQVGNAEGQGYTKTMHDPCPPGYMVMYHQVWFYNNNQNISYAGSSTGGTNLTNEDDFHNGGIVLTKSGFDRAWYPFTGFRNGGSGRVSTTGEGRIASCMPYSTHNTRGYNYTRTSTTQYSDYGSAVARVVRCMKE
ncbi:MAG: fimbrillin family protein [Alistipes sp.]|nr:fimbrillin family protein [Alistipes sp.]